MTLGHIFSDRGWRMRFATTTTGNDEVWLVWTVVAKTVASAEGELDARTVVGETGRPYYYKGPTGWTKEDRLSQKLIDTGSIFDGRGEAEWKGRMYSHWVEHFGHPKTIKVYRMQAFKQEDKAPAPHIDNPKRVGINVSLRTYDTGSSDNNEGAGQSTLNARERHYLNDTATFECTYPKGYAAVGVFLMGDRNMTHSELRIVGQYLQAERKLPEAPPIDVLEHMVEYKLKAEMPGIYMLETPEYVKWELALRPSGRVPASDSINEKAEDEKIKETLGTGGYENDPWDRREGFVALFARMQEAINSLL